MKDMERGSTPPELLAPVGTKTCSIGHYQGFVTFWLLLALRHALLVITQGPLSFGSFCH